MTLTRLLTAKTDYVNAFEIRRRPQSYNNIGPSPGYCVKRSDRGSNEHRLNCAVYIYSDDETQMYIRENGELNFSLIDYHVDFKYNKLYREYGRRSSILCENRK